MSTFVRSSTSRSSLKHRLFTVADENEIDDEEDDEEFEQFIKDNQIFNESSYINIKGIFEKKKKYALLMSFSSHFGNLVFGCFWRRS